MTERNACSKQRLRSAREAAMPWREAWLDGDPKFPLWRGYWQTENLDKLQALSKEVLHRGDLLRETCLICDKQFSHGFAHIQGKSHIQAFKAKVEEGKFPEPTEANVDDPSMPWVQVFHVRGESVAFNHLTGELVPGVPGPTAPGRPDVPAGMRAQERGAATAVASAKALAPLSAMRACKDTRMQTFTRPPAERPRGIK